MSLEEVIIKLHEIQAVKFGCFTLKSGIESPIYFDLRVIVSYPEIMEQVAELMCDTVKSSKCKFDSVCGVPYTALPIATVMSIKEKYPMLVRRKEAKDYGTKKMVEGSYKSGDSCLIVEDVVTSGSSVLETVECLKKEGLVVKDAVVLLDRQQGGVEKLKSQGINLHCVCSLKKLCEVLQEAGKLSEETVHQVEQFVIENNTFHPDQIITAPQKPVTVFDKFGPQFKVLTYKKRAAACSHPLVQQLFTIMATKETNLAVSADLTTCAQVLQLAEEVGPFICLLKTHVDILEDFTEEFTQKLRQLSDKYNFLIFEDRKFADIGNTVHHQYEGGMYRIADWAHITNAHALPGPGIIRALKQVGSTKGRGCLLLAQMSSKGSLAVDGYTASCVKMAKENKDFVIGFISQEMLTDDPDMVHMTPGIQLGETGDGLGQQYSTPHHAIVNNGSDVIIVGRGILTAPDRVQAAKDYRDTAYQAHLALLDHFS